MLITRTIVALLTSLRSTSTPFSPLRPSPTPTTTTQISNRVPPTLFNRASHPSRTLLYGVARPTSGPKPSNFYNVPRMKLFQSCLSPLSYAPSFFLPRREARALERVRRDMHVFGTVVGNRRYDVIIW